MKMNDFQAVAYQLHIETRSRPWPVTAADSNFLCFADQLDKGWLQYTSALKSNQIRYGTGWLSGHPCFRFYRLLVPNSLVTYRF